MCKWGTDIEIQFEGRGIQVDFCIAPIVIALNNAGVKTRACCCGHGTSDGSILLADGREIVIRNHYYAEREKVVPAEALKSVNTSGHTSIHDKKIVLPNY